MIETLESRAHDVTIDIAHRPRTAKPATSAASAKRWPALGAGLVGFLVGMLVTYATPVPAAPATPPTEQVAPLTLDAWLAAAAALDHLRPERGAQDALVRALRTSRSLYDGVLAHYAGQPDRMGRAAIRELLAATRSPSLAGDALVLSKATSPVARGAGFELMAMAEPSDVSFAAAAYGVNTEGNATALAGALIALQHPGIPSRSETATMLPRLVELTRHPDAMVRAHAVQRVAAWDPTGELATPIVLTALGDREGLIRKAAVGAVMIGRLRSDALQAALVRLIGDSTEDPVARSAALQAVQRMPLSDGELAVYRATRVELERDPPAQPASRALAAPE